LKICPDRDNTLLTGGFNRRTHLNKTLSRESGGTKRDKIMNGIAIPCIVPIGTLFLNGHLRRLKPPVNKVSPLSRLVEKILHKLTHLTQKFTPPIKL
jgi:hypothetical protein